MRRLRHVDAQVAAVLVLQTRSPVGIAAAAATPGGRAVRLRRAVWVDDPSFDIGHHVRSAECNEERVVMSPIIGRAVLAVSGVGFPLTQLVIRRYGKPGAVAVEVLCGALPVRVAAMIAVGTPDRLRRGPAVLLWLEAASAGAAVLTGLRPLVNADATHRAGGQRPPDRLEVARRTAIGALFGLHTWRFRIYLQPGSGLKPSEPHDAFPSPPDEKPGGNGTPPIHSVRTHRRRTPR